METETVENLNQFIKLVTSKYEYGYIYRGVSDIENHKLIPSVGRYLDKYLENGLDKFKLLQNESDAFRIFYKEARKDINLSNYWQWLAFAQHHGLATRLLDWTYNPNVALYFSVAKLSQADGAVYILNKDSEFLSVDEENNIDPLQINKMKVYLPSHVNDRIRAQSGLFTISPDPTIPLTENVVAKVRILNKGKQEIKTMLNRIGVNEKSLFTDIDGLSRWINWMKFDCLK